MYILKIAYKKSIDRLRNDLFDIAIKTLKQEQKDLKKGKLKIEAKSLVNWHMREIPHLRAFNNVSNRAFNGIFKTDFLGIYEKAFDRSMNSS